MNPPSGAPDKESGLVTVLKRYRLPILFVGHVAMFLGIYWVAFLLRFDFRIPETWLGNLKATLPLVLAIKMLVFYYMGSIHGWWRYVTFSDFITLLKASVTATVAVVLIDHFVLGNLQIPRGVILIDLILTIVLIGGLRSISRVWDERIAVFHSSRGLERALLVGSDFTAAKMAHLINSQPSNKTRIVGLVSAQKIPGKKKRFSDMVVVGAASELKNLVEHYRASTVFAPSGSLPAKVLRELLDLASEQDFKVRVVSSLDQSLAGSNKIPMRDVSVEDLLRRDPVSLDTTKIESLIAGKKILVTGAGGSIGSELCRQIVKFKPASLVLLGRGENRIFHIERELKSQQDICDLTPRIASVTDLPRMDETFATYQPDVVFHAAAHKHVPLVEANVGEGVHNNIYGTKVVADMAVKHNVERFVLVSTDKSVNPTSVMGCTKQMAERYCLALGAETQISTRFIVTRFGNVLGSAGSVIPVFQQQIQKGGPITITDSRMTRFFMTIPEASQLVLQAAAMGEGGEIFVLEMGQQVRIEDMARDLIRLAGLPADSIDIIYTGIRPGEKLYEELYYDDEEVMKTGHKKILSAYHRVRKLSDVNADIQSLIDLVFSPPEETRQRLRELVPEYFVPEENALPDPSATAEPVVQEIEEPTKV